MQPDAGKKDYRMNTRAIKTILGIGAIGLFMLPALYGQYEGASVDYLGYSGWTVSEEPVLPANETHPVLWFTGDDLPALRAKKDADERAGELWTRIAGSRFLTMEPETEDVIAGYMEEFSDPNHQGIQRYYAWLAQIAKYSAFMYVMETDDEKRQPYAERAIAVLMRAYDGPIYQLNPKEKTKVDEIYRGTWLQNYCSAYDWVHDALSPEQDEAIRGRLTREAQEIYDHLFVWAPRPHNHLSKPAWGLGTAALCFRDHPMASKWLERALAAANWNTRYMFSADGIYREGSHYYIFSYINFMPFLYHYRNVSGVDLFPAFQPAFEWPILVRNGKGWMPNLEDGYVKPFPSHTVAARYTDAVSGALHGAVPFAEVLAWNWETTDMGVFDTLLEENEWFFTGASLDYTHWLNEFLTYQPGIRATEPSVSPTVFLEGGQTVFRNRWDNGDGDQVYALFQGAAACDNHDHYDHLSFIVYARNQMMASDSGYGPGGYHKAERKEYNLRPWAHNTVTFNGKYLASGKENQTLPSRYRMDTDDFDFEEKEAFFAGQDDNQILYAKSIAGRLKRSIAFPGQRYFIVADRIAGETAGRGHLFLHGGKGRMKGDGNLRVWEYDEDRYGGKAKMYAWILAGDGKIWEEMGNVVYSKNEEEKYPYIDVQVEGQHIPVMQVIVPVGEDERPPALEELSDWNVLAARVSGETSVETFFLKMDHAPAEIAGLASDGTFALVSTVGGDPAYFMAREATTLSWEGAQIFRAEKPVTLVVELGDVLEVTLGSTHANEITFLNKGERPISPASHYDVKMRVEDDRVLLR